MAHCLSPDLEVGVKDGRIHALAGVRADTGECLTLSVTRLNLANALTRLHELADGAGFMLGHNLIDFDLHHLRATNPDLRLLTLPAVDTLRLNPLLWELYTCVHQTLDCYPLPVYTDAINQLEG